MTEAAGEAAAALDGTAIVHQPGRDAGRGYYDGFCFKGYGQLGTERVEVADGGFVDWTRRLVGSEKERLVISGIGMDRLAMVGSPV